MPKCYKNIPSAQTKYICNFNVHIPNILKKNFIALGVSAILLSGCGQGVPPLNFSVPNVGPSKHRINAELKSTTVTIARPDEKKGDLPFGIEGIPPMWKESLEESINRMALFKDDAAKKVSLSVKILAIDVPAIGLDFTTTVSARYELLDRETGAIIYTETVESSGEVPADFAFMGIARARESINRAVQNNISKFLMAVETVNVSRPIFSGRK